MVVVHLVVFPLREIISFLVFPFLFSERGSLAHDEHAKKRDKFLFFFFFLAYIGVENFKITSKLGKRRKLFQVFIASENVC